MGLLRIIKFLIFHPMNRGRRFSAVLKFVKFQISARLLGVKFLVDWVDRTKFLVSQGETGLTGNLYCGLMECEDMGFLLHYLRRGDTFYDIGANVGAYTLLASGVIGAKSVSFEPLPSTFDRLVDQIKINRIDHLVDLRNNGVGDKSCILEFTKNLNCENRVNTDPENKDVAQVDMIGLDDFFSPNKNSFVKIDVEGYEKFVLSGGKNFFSNNNVSALIIEINGSGASFGVDDNDLHKMILLLGFHPISYDPFNRKISPLETFDKFGNTIYVRDIDDAQHKVKTSQSVCVHTANDLKF